MLRSICRLVWKAATVWAEVAAYRFCNREEKRLYRLVKKLSRTVDQAVAH